MIEMYEQEKSERVLGDPERDYNGYDWRHKEKVEE